MAEEFDRVSENENLVVVNEGDSKEVELNIHDIIEPGMQDNKILKRCIGCMDIFLTIFICNCLCRSQCCINKIWARPILYTTFTFCFAWFYFIGAIFVVPYAAQMALNSLATASIVYIFIKRKELHYKDLRIVTCLYTLVVLFMSAYAVWSLKDIIPDDLAKVIRWKQFGIFISVINGIWLILSTLYLIIIDDETIRFIKEKDSGIEGHKLIAYGVNKFGPINGNYPNIIVKTHILLGSIFIICSFIFTQNNEMIMTEVIIIFLAIGMGALITQRFGSTRIKIKSLYITTQFLVFLLGLAGLRLLYALLGGLDFGNVFELPVQITFATFLVFIFMLYRTLEVIDFTMSVE